MLKKKKILDESKIQDGELIDKSATDDAAQPNNTNHRWENFHRAINALYAHPRFVKTRLRLKKAFAEGVKKLRPYIAKAEVIIKRKISWLLAKSSHESLRKPRAVLRITMVFFALLLIWAIFFNIDQVVHGQGQIIASSRTQIIQAADGGVLTELFVQEGDEVASGQIIAVLEKDRALAAYTESFGKVIALRLTVARLRAELAETELVYAKELYAEYPLLLDTQIILYRQRQRGYQDQIKILEENVRLAAEELRMNMPLEKLGDISKVDILRLRRAVNEAQSSLVNYRTRYFQDASTELNKAEEDLNAQEQSLKDRAQLLEHTNIVAPTAGIVKNIRITTLGGVVRQGDELMHIFPTESELIVEAKIKPADMAFLKPGLPAKVKLDAFDYSVFGAMKGRVSYISPDSLTDDTKMGPETYYRVRVAIGDQDLQNSRHKEIEIKPGMTATVDIKTDQRSVMTFLMKPLVKTLNASMGEK